MDATTPSLLSWIFAVEDEPIARELLGRAGVLEAQGLVRNTVLTTGQADASESGWPASSHAAAVRRADVVIFLCSNALFSWATWTPALRTAEQAGSRIVPILISTTLLPKELQPFQPLPSNGTPILGRGDREQAILEVFQGLLDIVKYRRRSPEESIRNPPPVTARGAAALSINEIFQLDGPPSITFVEPPSFAQLKLELRTMGTGLIVEGPSKVGKSTAIRKAMEALGVGASDQIWWHGQRPPSLPEFSKTLEQLLVATRDTWLFIDDFHHLEDEHYRRELAAIMKVLADQPERHAKVTLIGINPLGNSLVQVMPDLSGRFRIIRLDIEKDWKGSTKIAELIIRGETAANIRFTRRDEFMVAAGGSFFLAQYLCNTAAVKAGVVEAQPVLVEISLGPPDVIASIQGELAARFRAPMIDFASFDAAPPPRGAMLSLLWLLARASDGFISVREARLRFPMLNEGFDWLLASNLSRCFQVHRSLEGLLYYNRATQTLTLEDPQLKFYLRAVDWEELAAASGHGSVRVHAEDGPLWPVMGGAQISVAGDVLVASGEATGASKRAARRLLHLSDLHFSTNEEAVVSYSQLAADLRDQAIEALDFLVVSGDLVNRADSAEYDAARQFLEKLMTGFALSPRQVTLVPGNHDVSWPIAEEAYLPHRRTRYSGKLVPGAYIEHSGGFIEVRDDAAYRNRFQAFSDLYRAIKGTPYPLAYEDQGTIDEVPELGLCVLGLNSAWETDHHFRDRASIHREALANALLKLGAAVPGQLRIATFHHPIHGGEDSRIRDAGFLQQLAVHGFQLALHGHVHKADAELYRYDRAEGGRRIEVIAAGTFGAPTREWVPGYPLEYNLLLIRPEQITVETRCRREVNGAWGADARWLQGPGRDPLPRYVIQR